MNITVKDVPENLHSRLKEAANETGRSVNKLIIVTLEHALMARRASRAAVIKRIRSRRDQMDPLLDDAGLQSAIKEGRE